MKKILIALDNNTSAQTVTEMGYTLARALDAEPVLIHVIPDLAYYSMHSPDIMGYGFAPNFVDNTASARKEAQKFLSSCAASAGDSGIRTIILEGETEKTILQCCDDEKADLLVMGSHRHKGIESILLTDVAAYILRHSKIPLLTIPNSRHLEKTKQINGTSIF